LIFFVCIRASPACQYIVHRSANFLLRLKISELLFQGGTQVYGIDQQTVRF
jgi:hypothetical protein